MRFEYNALEQGLYRLRKTKEKESRSLAKRQGNFFVRIAKRISFQHAPDPAQIHDLLQKFGGRIKRAKGVTPEQEIGRRILQIGLLARNWRFWKVEKAIGRLRIYIRDNVNYSKVVDDEQGLVSQAVKAARPGLKKGMDQSVKKIVKNWNNGTV